MEVFLHFFTIFSAVFPYIWPLAGPNIAKKGWPLLGKLWKGFGRVLEKLNFQAVIKPAASAAGLITVWKFGFFTKIAR